MRANIFEHTQHAHAQHMHLEHMQMRIATACPHATLHNVQSDASLCTSGKSALIFSNNKINYILSMCLDHALASVVFLLKLLPGSFRAVNG